MAVDPTGAVGGGLNLWSTIINYQNLYDQLGAQAHSYGAQIDILGVQEEQAAAQHEFAQSEFGRQTQSLQATQQYTRAKTKEDIRQLRYTDAKRRISEAVQKSDLGEARRQAGVVSREQSAMAQAAGARQGRSGASRAYSALALTSTAPLEERLVALEQTGKFSRKQFESQLRTMNLTQAHVDRQIGLQLESISEQSELEQTLYDTGEDIRDIRIEDLEEQREAAERQRERIAGGGFDWQRVGAATSTSGVSELPGPWQGGGVSGPW